MALFKGSRKGRAHREEAQKQVHLKFMSEVFDLACDKNDWASNRGESHISDISTSVLHSYETPHPTKRSAGSLGLIVHYCEGGVVLPIPVMRGLILPEESTTAQVINDAWNTLLLYAPLALQTASSGQVTETLVDFANVVAEVRVEITRLTRLIDAISQQLPAADTRDDSYLQEFMKKTDGVAIPRVHPQGVAGLDAMLGQGYTLTLALGRLRDLGKICLMFTHPEALTVQ